MSPPKTKILFTGAVGYIGGSVFSRLVEHPDRASFEITTFVRTPERAEKLKQFAPDVNVVVGTNEDPGNVLENLAAEADIVFSTTDSYTWEPVEVVLKGFKRRFEKTGLRSTIIHTSSAGVLADESYGEFGTDVVFNDMDADQLDTCSPEALHQNVHQPLLAESKQGYFYSHIICPTLVFGTPHTKLFEAGIQKDGDYTCVAFYNIGAECGGARCVGKGKNVVGLVNIDHLAEFYLILFDKVLKDASSLPHGREGIYLMSEDEFTWGDYGRLLGEALVKAGKASSPEPQPYTEEELDEYFPGSYRRAMGGNGRCVPNRAISMGWKPSATKEDLFAWARNLLEVTRNRKEGEAQTTAAEKPISFKSEVH